MILLKDFEAIKSGLDNLADRCNLDIHNSPQYADAVDAIDKLAKILMRRDFIKGEPK